MGWELDTDPCKVVNAFDRRQLISDCQSVRQSMKNKSNAVDGTTSDINTWRDQILGDLEVLMEPWFTNSASPPIAPNFYASLTLDAIQAMHTLSSDVPVAINEFAAELGVSRRTLFRAFRKSLGLGPYNYLRILRLNQLRERLKSGHPETNTIFELAHSCGFNNMGHLTAAYKSHFGELPSETLRWTKT